MIKLSTALIGVVLAGAGFTGCTTVGIYQDPVARFQTAVNTANDAVRPYLLGVNDLNAKANLYDKIALNLPWGTEDLTNAIPPAEIQVRLQALACVGSYANALAAVATSQDTANLAQAAGALGDSVNGLSGTIQGLAAIRARGGANSPVAKQAAALDLGAPVTALVNLVGTLAIEHAQTKAVQAAILNGEQPISQLIGLLKTDLQNLTVVDDAAYASIKTGMVLLYNNARAKTDAKDLAPLIDQFLQDNDKIETLRALQVDSLLSDMQGAHSALVAFAKSSKSPRDLAQLASQIDVFTAHVALFAAAVSSVKTTINSTH
jgi:hypothetical protein